MTDADFSDEQYKKLIQEMLDKLKDVLDEHVVVKIVRDVEGVTVSENGEVLSIEGPPQDIIQRLMDRFLGLSNDVVVKTLQPLLTQCPWIKISTLDK